MKDVLGLAFEAWLAAFLPDPFGPATACLRSPRSSATGPTAASRISMA